MFVAGYGHFLRTAASLQWEQAAVDLSADARAWPALAPALRERLLRLIAGFCVAETAVAADIVPFELAAHDPDAAACFGAQAVDEWRHACFFDRVAADVAKVPGADAEERRGALRSLLEPEFVKLFEERLSAAARGLARDGGLPEAVSLYHLLLEGIVFSAGQLALVRLLDEARPPLPGLRRGLELVAGDERWHIGLGARLLEDAGIGDEGVERLLSEGEAVAGVWGEAVDPDLVERVLELHARRLRASASPRARAGDAAQAASWSSSGPPFTPFETATS